MDADTAARTGPTILKPVKNLAGPDAARLKDEVRAALQAGEDVILDMSEVRFTDSEGLSALVACYKTACTEERRLLLAGPRQNLRALLELTRLHRVFDVVEDLEVAKAALAEGAGR